MKKHQKINEFNLLEHITKSIGEMFEAMDISYNEDLVVESPKLAREYGITGVAAIRATKYSDLCNGLMPYYVYTYDKNYDGQDCLHWTAKHLINVHNYVVYAYNKWVDKQTVCKR